MFDLSTSEGLRQAQEWAAQVAASANAETPESNTSTFELAEPDQNGEFASPLDGALWMARIHGKRQIPLNGKAAFLTNWQEQATTDPAQIRDWYEQFRCNFGSVADDGEIFEVDSPEVRKRFHGQFSNTLTVASSEGKGHRYYLPTDDIDHIAQNATKHADFSLRKHNAYCVSPGSIHPGTGKQYRVVVNAPMVAPTQEEIAFWNDERVEKKPAPVPADESIPAGQRNSTITSILGRARQNVGADYDALIALARQHNQRCIPPLPESELETISRSIAGYDIQPVGKLEFQKSEPVQVQELELENVPVNPSEASANALDFLPVGTLASTRLQDIYMDYFEPYDWPLTLALPSLVTAGSVIVPQNGAMLGDSMTNHFTALIANVGAGKSQIIQWACRALGIFEEPMGSHYITGKWGSAEQLLVSLVKKQATFTGKAVLVDPDEWSHLFAKAAIPEASFPSVLTTAFYRRNQVFTVGGTGGGREHNINLAMSFIGGIVEDEFDTVFGAASLGGLYDRFLFGRAPDKFQWQYQPCPVPDGKHWLGWGLRPVTVNPSVYEVTKQWGRENPALGMTRIPEVCVRIATIYGCLDGRPEITGKNLEPLKPLALYQLGLRKVFRPNPGANPDAVFANKALDWIQKYANEWTSIAKLKQSLWRVEQKLGPQVANRALIGLARSGRIQLWLSDATGYAGGANPPADYHGPRPRIGLVRSVR
jgi:hypothetical protein